MGVSAIALALAVWSGGAQDDAAKLDETLASAGALVRSAKLDEAVPLVDQVLAGYDRAYGAEKRPVFCGSTAPDDVLAMTAAAATQRGAVLVGGGWCLALFYRGYILNDRKQFGDAIPYLERASIMAPGKASYLAELGYAYQQSRQFDRSMDAYRRAEAVASMTDGADGVVNRARALRGQGYDLVELGKLDEAEVAYRQSLKYDPDSALAKGELDYIAQQKGKKH